MNKNIIFCGDSFAASYKEVGVCFYYPGCQNNPLNNNQDRGRGPIKWSIAHPSQVASHYGYNLYNFAYGGKSWWYSRCVMFNYLRDFPELLENTQAMVFFHTDSHRLNISSKFESDNNTWKTVQKLWKMDLIDEDFQPWAQMQWFKEIDQHFGSVPSIHFHCFPETVQYDSFLPGMRFTTPLIHLSVGELTGSDSEISTQLSDNETRVNHLNAHNNQALADVIINALDNYQPGSYPIDTSKFDLINPNASKWPTLGYGTK
jgi:hypothetical protein